MIAINIQSIGSYGILGDEHQEWYQKAVSKLGRRKESTLADVMIILLIALIMISIITNLEDLDVSSELTNWVTQKEDDDPSLTITGWWYFLISSSALKIMLFHWFWRFLIWGDFLFHISRVKLKLQPIHPDLAGGLGYKLSRVFHKKWGNTSDPTTGDELVKTADTSAVCDYADIFESFREMRYLPMCLKDYTLHAMVLLTPFLPLALTQFSVSELIFRTVDTLI